MRKERQQNMERPVKLNFMYMASWLGINDTILNYDPVYQARRETNKQIPNITRHTHKRDQLRK